MSRYSSGTITAAAITSTRPAIGLYNTAAGTGAMRECGVSNTAAAQVAVHMALVTATGTQVATPPETKHRDQSFPAICTAVTWSADPTVGATCGFRQMLGAAIGAGVIWTFGGDGLQAPIGTANGVAGGALESGTGQIVECYIVWDE